MPMPAISKTACDLVRQHEGCRAFPYVDTVGKLTIGIGRNLTDRGLAPDEISYLFRNDMQLAQKICLNLFTGFSDYDAVRQAALLSMAFNLGAPRLAKFQKMRAAINAGDWQHAASHALHSKWARQVPERAANIAALLRG